MFYTREVQHFLTTLSSPIDTVEIDSSLVFYDIMEGRNPFERTNSTLVAKGKAYKKNRQFIYTGKIFEREVHTALK